MELEEIRSSLQDASEQIADLNMQQTIMTSGADFISQMSYCLFYS